MRWYIAEYKRRIATEDLEGHSDDIEMSGEKVSYIVGYSVSGGLLTFGRRLIYPNLRIQPDVTQSSFQLTENEPAVQFPYPEEFVRAEIDGTLRLYSKSGNMSIVHIFYPSVAVRAAYETVEVTNVGTGTERPTWREYKKIDGRIGCEGWIYTERRSDKPCKPLSPGESITVTFSFTARFANEQADSESDPLGSRMKRVMQLFSECDLTTGNDVIDTMYTFAKLRVGESIYNTRKGRVNSPGGTNYYAAVWCNDQCEYSTPWFGFTGDEIERQAAENAMRWYEPYMNDEYEPVPSSIISEGTDYWNGRRDRGDASMYLYGNCRFFLERGELPDERAAKMLAWCAEYCVRQITPDGVVFSDTDELEYRLSSGINLSTSSLCYGAFGYYAALLKRMGKRVEAERIEGYRSIIREGIEKYFGGTVSGYETYHYHKGCDEVRAWNCLPAYMGITERAKGSFDAIDDKLWRNGSCLSTENENIMWDRSAIYYIAALFRAGDVERAYKKLADMSINRLLGERVPYVVEAYPEFNMRHLSAESALFCRIVTDGLFNIDFDENGFTVNPRLPKEICKATLKDVMLGGKLRTITAEGGKVTVTPDGDL